MLEIEIETSKNQFSDAWEEAIEQQVAVRRKIMLAVQDAVRDAFGHPAVEDHWHHETLLFNLIQALYPEYAIERHHRPEWLEGLELDIFLPEVDLAIEYQGRQHFEAIEHWGGVEGLQRQQENDARKAAACASRGVDLVYFTWEDELTPQLVEERVARWLSSPGE
jgi:hypothetical protein